METMLRRRPCTHWRPIRVAKRSWTPTIERRVQPGAEGYLRILRAGLHEHQPLEGWPLPAAEGANQPAGREAGIPGGILRGPRLSTYEANRPRGAVGGRTG